MSLGISLRASFALLGLLALPLFFAGCAGLLGGTAEGEADLVFYGENIHTVDVANADAEAVAVRFPALSWGL